MFPSSFDFCRDLWNELNALSWKMPAWPKPLAVLSKMHVRSDPVLLLSVCLEVLLALKHILCPSFCISLCVSVSFSLSLLVTGTVSNVLPTMAPFLAAYQYPLSPYPRLAESLKCWVNRHTHTHRETDIPRLLLQKEYILNFTWTLLDEASRRLFFKEPDSALRFYFAFPPSLSLLGHESDWSSGSHFVSMTKSWGWNLY